MPTYHVQHSWKAKRPMTFVSHDLENPSQPRKKEFAEACSKSLGGHPELDAILLQS